VERSTPSRKEPSNRGRTSSSSIRTSRVESLRDQDLDARTADIRESGVADPVADRDVILILASDVESNKRAVEHIRKSDGDQFIVAPQTPSPATNSPNSGPTSSSTPPRSSPNPPCAPESGELEYNGEARRSLSRHRRGWRSSLQTARIRTRSPVQRRCRRSPSISTSNPISSISGRRPPGEPSVRQSARDRPRPVGRDRGSPRSTTPLP